jgi:uncharacterized protein with GYD domain
MKFLVLVKWHQDTASKMAALKFVHERGREKGQWDLPEGVKIIDGLRLFGGYDIAVIYEAPDEETGMEFMSEIWPYAEIKRFLTTSCPWCDNIKR